MTATADQARQVADTIRKQLGVFGLGVVGASNLGYTTTGQGALTFKARLHFVDRDQTRVMRVTIVLTAADLYDIRVTRPNYTDHVYAEGVHADQLTDLMYRLDAEGVPAA